MGQEASIRIGKSLLPLITLQNTPIAASEYFGQESVVQVEEGLVWVSLLLTVEAIDEVIAFFASHPGVQVSRL